MRCCSSNAGWAGVAGLEFIAAREAGLLLDVAVLVMAVLSMFSVFWALGLLSSSADGSAKSVVVLT